MTTTTDTKARPFVKWVGGKNGLLDQLRPLMPKTFGRYFEPFVGGGAVFFDLRPDRAMISDANSELINCYFSIRDKVDEVIRILREIPINEKTFYHYRENIPVFDPPRAAARTIYLNKTCFNGLYRVNKEGKFNVAWGKKEPKQFPAAYDFDNLLACSKALRSATIRVADFHQVECVRSISKGDFIYLDPPYVPVSKTANFTSYTAGKFGPKEQERLARWFRQLSDDGVKLMMSNSDTPTIRKLFKGFQIDTVQARRAVNCDGAKRGKVTEIVVRNYGGHGVDRAGAPD